MVLPLLEAGDVLDIPELSLPLAWSGPFTLRGYMSVHCSVAVRDREGRSFIQGPGREYEPVQDSVGYVARVSTEGLRPGGYALVWTFDGLRLEKPFDLSGVGNRVLENRLLLADLAAEVEVEGG